MCSPWAADRVWGGGRGKELLGGIIPPSFHAHPWHSHQTCSGPDSPKSLGFFCNLWRSPHQQLGCSARIREIIKVKGLIVVARSDRNQFGGRAGVPRMELFPYTSQMIPRGHFKIVLNCTRLQADPLWLQRHQCAIKQPFTSPSCLHFTPNFWLACIKNKQQTTTTKKKEWKENRTKKRKKKKKERIEIQTQRSKIRGGRD